MMERDQPRSRALAAVETAPGSHLAWVSRLAQVAPRVLLYHLRRLSDEGRVVAHRGGPRWRFYPSEPHVPRSDRDFLAVVREPGALALCLALLMDGQMRPRSLFMRTRLARSSFFHQSAILMGEGIISRAEGDLRVEEPDRLGFLLKRCPPSEDELRYLRLSDWPAERLALWRVRSYE